MANVMLCIVSFIIIAGRPSASAHDASGARQISKVGPGKVVDIQNW